MSLVTELLVIYQMCLSVEVIILLMVAVLQIYTCSCISIR